MYESNDVFVQNWTQSSSLGEDLCFRSLEEGFEQIESTF